MVICPELQFNFVIHVYLQRERLPTILFVANHNISPKKRLEFNRKLYGYRDLSNFGAYTYFRKGILEQGTYLRLTKGVVLMDKIPKELIRHLKEYKAQYKILKVIA